MTEQQNVGARAGRGLSLIVCGSCLGIVGLTMSCAPPAPANPTAPPAGATVQAAGTQIGAAAGALATVQTAVVQPTVSAARTQIVTAAQGVGTAVAPTVEAARTQVAPTVAAARTTGAVAGAAPAQTQATSATVARQTTATALAPTAQSVATRVAPAVQAAATQIASSVGTSVAVSPLHVINVTVDADDTTVAIQNGGSGSMTLGGWTLVMGPDFSMVLSDITINAGQTRTLHFSQGTDTANDAFMGFGSNAARLSLRPGTRVALVAPSDQIASIYSIT
jgi:hypothetical protein